MTQNIETSSGQPVQPILISASSVQDVSLLSNTTVMGAGASKPIGGYKTLRIEVWGTGSFSMQIQVNDINGSGTFYPIQAVNLSTMSTVSSITAAGIYDLDVSGFSNVLANVLSISGGNVNAVGKWVA